MSKVLSDKMIEFLNEHPDLLDGIDTLTYVPLHNRRLRERGFNQSQLLAENLVEFLNKEGQNFIFPPKQILARSKKTESQTQLSRPDRAKNVEDAFAVDAAQAGLIQGQNILLIDDVCTSSATLNECARALKAAGAGTVSGLTLARD